MDEERLDYDELVCFDCKQTPYHSKQVYFLCNHNFMTFCMNHFKNVCTKCNIPRQNGTALRPFNEHRIQLNLLHLKRWNLKVLTVVSMPGQSGQKDQKSIRKTKYQNVANLKQAKRRKLKARTDIEKNGSSC